MKKKTYLFITVCYYYAGGVQWLHAKGESCWGKSRGSKEGVCSKDRKYSSLGSQRGCKGSEGKYSKNE